MATKADSNVFGGYSYSCSLVSMGEVPTGTILVVPIACGQRDNWNNNGLISVHQNDFVRISANKATTYSVRIAFIRRGKV